MIVRSISFTAAVVMLGLTRAGSADRAPSTSFAGRVCLVP